MKYVLRRAAMLPASLSLVAIASAAQAAEWIPCARIDRLRECELQAFPSTRYEYGITYLTNSEPLPVVCTFWNSGRRIYNKHPFLNYSDNPAAGMRWGGFVFYTGTNAPDDDIGNAVNQCKAESPWRHRYWWINPSGSVSTGDSNGCYGTNVTLYCRER
ncbi:hypothetical protein [Sorangium cellulosum]|uniref:hypothetical protein n=1 Tax=Sorangium cellulosum TaxID=56 RepID=UPI0004017CED|nr:hypothetical protein [Sorangium cellulosum]